VVGSPGGRAGEGRQTGRGQARRGERRSLLAGGRGAGGDGKRGREAESERTGVARLGLVPEWELRVGLAER